MANVVTDVYVKCRPNYDRLRIDKALGIEHYI